MWKQIDGKKTIYEIGKILEARAVSKTRKSISSLMDIKPEYANIKINDDVKKVLPDEVKIGDIIVVKAGEKIPLDGKVIPMQTGQQRYSVSTNQRSGVLGSSCRMHTIVKRREP